MNDIFTIALGVVIGKIIYNTAGVLAVEFFKIINNIDQRNRKHELLKDIEKIIS